MHDAALATRAQRKRYGSRQALDGLDLTRAAKRALHRHDQGVRCPSPECAIPLRGFDDFERSLSPRQYEREPG